MTKTSWPALTAWRPGRGTRSDAAALLPAVLPAGAEAGNADARGRAPAGPDRHAAARLARCAPPEGDAGTGMAAT